MGKGRPILVEGRLKLDQWTGQDGAKKSRHTVVVDNFTFLGSREGLELNKAFSRLSNPAHRRAVIELVRALAGDRPEVTGGAND